MASADITATLRTAFPSERLVYRAVENNDRDKKLISENLDNDPVNMGLSNPSLVRPSPLKQAEWVVEQLNKALLGVVICLPPPAAEAGGEGRRRGREASGTGGAHAHRLHRAGLGGRRPAAGPGAAPVHRHRHHAGGAVPRQGLTAARPSTGRSDMGLPLRRMHPRLHRHRRLQRARQPPLQEARLCRGGPKARGPTGSTASGTT